MVDEQVSAGARVEIDAEPEPADPLITPATSALDRPDQPRPTPPDRKPKDKIKNGNYSIDKEGTISRTNRLSMRNGKENPFLGKYQPLSKYI